MSKKAKKPVKADTKQLDVAPDDIALRFELLLGMLREKCPCINFRMGVENAVPIVGMLRLALRNPGVKKDGYPARVVKSFIFEIEKTIAQFSPDVVELIRLMDDHRYDVVVNTKGEKVATVTVEDQPRKDSPCKKT